MSLKEKRVRFGAARSESEDLFNHKQVVGKSSKGSMISGFEGRQDGRSAIHGSSSSMGNDSCIRSFIKRCSTTELSN